MNIPVNFRLDNNGLLRKECPFCEREFKVFYNEHAETKFEKFYCPHCGLPAPFDEQLTKSQVEYIHDLASNALADEINSFLKSMKSKSRKSFVKIDVKPLEKTNPKLLIEMEDMERVITSCCNESIFLDSPLTWKVVYCHLCGNINFPA